MDEPTEKQKQWYIKYYNSLVNRKKCSGCGAQTEAALNNEGAVYITLSHKEDCKLWLEWLEWSKDKDKSNEGLLFLDWCIYKRNKNNNK